MTRFLSLFLALSLALAVAGCIDYEETLELNADGSGTLAMHIAVYKHYFEELSQMMESTPPDSSQDSSMFKLFKRADLEKQLKERKSSVKLLDFKEQETDSVIAYDIKYAFKDLKEMMAISEKMGKEEMMAEPGSEPEVTFAKDNTGVWRFTRDFQAASFGEMMQGMSDSGSAEAPSTDTVAAGDSLAQALAEGMDSAMTQMGSFMEGMMAEAFGKHKMRFTVKFPGKVVESNATAVSGNTTTWEYKFTELAKAPKQLQAVIKP